MAVTAFTYMVFWGNPYTQPPNGMERIQIAVTVPCDHKGEGACRRPAEVEQKWRELGGPGSGWSNGVGAVESERRRATPEQRAKIRLQRLRARIEKRNPLFAEDFIAEAIARKPAYFSAEGIAAEDAAWEAAHS